jgi:hypothetical protein
MADEQKNDVTTMDDLKKMVEELKKQVETLKAPAAQQKPDKGTVKAGDIVIQPKLCRGKFGTFYISLAQFDDGTTSQLKLLKSVEYEQAFVDDLKAGKVTKLIAAHVTVVPEKKDERYTIAFLRDFDTYETK